ncbi:MAG: type II secretion system protein GspM [Kofleriaceae bacterium]|nr:type II secretion system protein GspM [Kofleriaceae bacterium]
MATSSSSLAERARDFWDRISPRERRLVVLLAVAVPLTIAVWLGLSIQDGLVAKEKNNDDMRKALVVIEDLKARGPAQPTDDVVATMGTEPLSLDTYLTNAAQKAGFQLKGTTPRSPVTRNGYVTNSVSCQVSDLTIDQLRKFLQEVESASKVVIVTKLDVRRDFKDKEKLDANLEVSTYSKEPPAKGEGKDKDAGSAGSAETKGS